MTTNQQSIVAICNDIANTIAKKNHDYGGAFGKQIDKWGIMYAAAKISEKNDRIETLATQENAVVGESLEDALLDCAGYCILTLDQLYQKKMSEEQ